MNRGFAFRPDDSEYKTVSVTYSGLEIDADSLPDHDLSGDTQEDRIRRLARAVLCRAILDATNSNEFPRDNEKQEIKLGQAYFRKRREHPYGWGWIINVLRLNDRQVRSIERVTLRNIMDVGRFRYAN